jgi:hypothetical protein
MKKLLLPILCVASFGQAMAAEWGVGVGFGENAGGVYVPVALSADVRVEPFVAYSESNYASNNGFSARSTALTAGTGLFHTRALGDGLTAYLGGRLGYLTYQTRESSGLIFAEGQPGPAFVRKGKGFQVVPTVGVDYRFHKALSLGGEVGLSYTRAKLNVGSSYGGDQQANSTSKDTVTRLLMKYHFQ